MNNKVKNDSKIRNEVNKKQIRHVNKNSFTSS